MAMRTMGLVGTACVLVLASCASLAGIDEYSGDPCDGCDDGGADVRATPTGAKRDAAPGSEFDASTSGASPDSGSPGSTEVSPQGFDATSGPDAPVTLPDAGSPVDARGALVDAAPEATVDAAADAPSCTSASCNGCCTPQGLCAAGGLAKACGTGGSSCVDCTGSGLGCVSGTCATPPPPVDSGGGPPACNPSTCGNLCVPYFIQCCKSDQSCGCALLFPRGSCN